MSSGANNNIAKLPQQSKNFYVVSSEGFNQALGDGQNVHFTSQEYRDFGKRYAEKMIEVLGDKINPVASTVSSSSKTPESSASVSSSSTLPGSSEVAKSSSSHHHRSSSSVVGPVSSSTESIDIVTGVSSHIGKAVFESGRVSVPVKVNGTKVVAKVYSMLGKEVFDFSNSYSNGTLGFSATSLSQGYYMLSVQVGSEHSVQKVLVK